jgi:hypothetical protein
MAMGSKAESYLAIVMGIIIILADIYWLLFDNSYTVPQWLVSAIIILVASLVWIGIDFHLMRK